jgi:glycosyltransferase involved in cell wall biosynthesis
MRILLVNTRHFYGGGDSTYTFNLANLLTHHGHEVAFFAMQDERNLSNPNTDLFVSPIDYRELNQHKSLANGIKVLTRTIYSTEARAKFSKLLDRFSPDLIHLQNFLRHITPSILYEAKRRGIPMVWTLHDYWLICPNAHLLIDRTGQICEACKKGRFYEATLKRCKKNSLLASSMATFEAYCNRWTGISRMVDAFLCPSDFLKRKIFEDGFHAGRAYHLPLCLAEENFWAGEQDQGYILFLGRLETIKGIDVLIEAIGMVPGVVLLMAGSISKVYSDRLPHILPENARYVGMKYGQELADLIHNAIAIVLPSIWYENQPFSILEAFASGKPVITTNLGGMTELVAHRERGLLVNPGDPGALAEAMKWAASNYQSMKKMGRNARQYALENHSPEAHYRSLFKIYNQVCATTVS